MNVTQVVEGLVAKVEILEKQVAELKAAEAKRSGPKSEREMTEADATRILLGDLKDKSHTEAAKELNLSYGQIYSARKGFTFKKVYQESLKVK
jgi:hypothetical protein